jgi:hypothetical protein
MVGERWIPTSIATLQYSVVAAGWMKGITILVRLNASAGRSSLTDERIRAHSMPRARALEATCTLLDARDTSAALPRSFAIPEG